MSPPAYPPHPYFQPKFEPGRELRRASPPERPTSEDRSDRKAERPRPRRRAGYRMPRLERQSVASGRGLGLGHTLCRVPLWAGNAGPWRWSAMEMQAHTCSRPPEGVQVRREPAQLERTADGAARSAWRSSSLRRHDDRDSHKDFNGNRLALPLSRPELPTAEGCQCGLIDSPANTFIDFQLAD